MFSKQFTNIGHTNSRIKKLEPNVTAEILTRFKMELETEILKSLKRGLKQEIRIELGEHQTLKRKIN